MRCPRMMALHTRIRSPTLIRRPNLIRRPSLIRRPNLIQSPILEIATSQQMGSKTAAERPGRRRAGAPRTLGTADKYFEAKPFVYRLERCRSGAGRYRERLGPHVRWN